MQTLLILITICLLLISIVQSQEESLQYYATSALQSQKDGVIICPIGSNNVCIKEVVNATSRADCGSIEGPYFGRDVWDRKLAQCIYRENVQVDVQLLKRTGQEHLVETRMTLGKKKHHPSLPDNRQHKSSIEHHIVAILTFATKEKRDCVA